MADRRDLQKELNRINELYHQKDLELQKAGGTIEQRQMMRDMLNKKKESLIAEMGDDLQKLNIGKQIPIKQGFKKLAGIIPLAGAGMAALSGEPAMAAEELAQDVAGPIGEALRSESAGMSSADERQMLAEANARKNYLQSPAAQDRAKTMGVDMGTYRRLKQTMSPEMNEQLTGVEHPVAKARRDELMRAEDKVAQLEEQGDEQSLAFWRKKLAELQGR